MFKLEAADGCLPTGDLDWSKSVYTPGFDGPDKKKSLSAIKPINGNVAKAPDWYAFVTPALDFMDVFSDYGAFFGTKHAPRKKGPCAMKIYRVGTSKDFDKTITDVKATWDAERSSTDASASTTTSSLLRDFKSS